MKTSILCTSALQLRATGMHGGEHHDRGSEDNRDGPMVYYVWFNYNSMLQFSEVLIQSLLLIQTPIIIFEHNLNHPFFLIRYPTLLNSLLLLLWLFLAGFLLLARLLSEFNGWACPLFKSSPRARRSAASIWSWRCFSRRAISSGGRCDRSWDFLFFLDEDFGFGCCCCGGACLASFFSDICFSSLDSRIFRSAIRLASSSN